MKSPAKTPEKTNDQPKKTSKGKVFEGTVVSVKMNNTIIVAVTEVTRHPLYRKTMKSTHRYAVDTAQKSATLGQKVRIMECKPISKTKHFRLQEVIQ